jgi:hypothetical protein
MRGALYVAALLCLAAAGLGDPGATERCRPRHPDYPGQLQSDDGRNRPTRSAAGLSAEEDGWQVGGLVSVEYVCSTAPCCWPPAWLGRRLWRGLKFTQGP